VFQPHRYSRLRDCWDGFCASFQRADMVIVCPVYAAGEAPTPGVDHEAFTVALRERGQRGVTAVADLDAAVAELLRRVQPGDVVITLGAGNVNEVCNGLLSALEQG
jgi:UDP-N-acetylmuramate--alanine ligase